ncbi:hypothetical protein E2C01_058974 [Portunus trituberculatus]|uniref:NLE domain-containing protein n=1 Tax=Portunus trituberculatus TaxID=210409 RepID=A0A5B7H1A0_PORTR|nr:hypothetical protein [Portunus trituberculatus]
MYWRRKHKNGSPKGHDPSMLWPEKLPAQQSWNREGNKRILEEEEDSDEEISPSLTEKPTKKKTTGMDDDDSLEDKENVLAQFQSESGEAAGPPVELPLNLPREKLQQILNALLQQVCFTV